LIFIPDDYISIQEAINGVADVDLAYLKSENMVIKKSKSLIAKKEIQQFTAAMKVIPSIVLMRTDKVDITYFTISKSRGEFLAVQCHTLARVT
jgi:hypothetical protein